MKPMVPTGAIILTGGASRRMQTDKATLVVDGARLVDRVIATVTAAGVDRIVIAGPDPEGLGPGIGAVADRDLDRQGPLAGISAAWPSFESEDPILVLACDLPRLTAAVVTDLVATARAHPAGAQAHDGERDQPLIAAYRRSTLAQLVEAFAAGERSISRVLADQGLARVPACADILGDADSPGDLEGHDVAWPTRRGISGP